MRPLFGQFRCAYSGKIRKSDGTGGHHFANLARELCPLRTSTRRIHSDFMNIEGPFDIHKAKACSLWKPLQGHFDCPSNTAQHCTLKSCVQCSPLFSPRRATFSRCITVYNLFLYRRFVQGCTHLSF